MPQGVEAVPESGLWKDYLNKNTLGLLATEIQAVHKKFDGDGFLKAVLANDFTALELKERIARVAQVLREFLPSNYPATTRIFVKAAPRLRTFLNLCLMSYIEQFGLEDFDTSIEAMEALTGYSSAEFAIRPFMNRYTKEMIPVLRRWAASPNEHVRRLAAEGSRPRGVWTAHIDAFRKDPTPVVKLLESLKADPSLYVRKAVANNLNDISKDHPDVVIKVAGKWKKDGDKHTDWIVRHACRSLIKLGDPRVFPLLGFTTSPKVELVEFRMKPKKAEIGAKVELNGEIRSAAKTVQKLAIDYRVHYVTKRGGTTSRVFKLSEKKLPAGGSLPIRTQHSFKNTSTRTHYAGKHRLELIVNGLVVHSLEFNLR
jgi:3-methyladenine DNA glycosylase AlkC